MLRALLLQALLPGARGLGSACMACRNCQSMQLRPNAGAFFNMCRPTPHGMQVEVEGLASERDSLTSEVQTAGASAKALRVQVTASQRELEAVTADLQRAQGRLSSLEAAQRAEQERDKKERAAATAAAEREAAAHRQRLAAERNAAQAAVQQGKEALARQAAALEQRAARMEEQGRGLVDRDAALQDKEREFEGQVGAGAGVTVLHPCWQQAALCCLLHQHWRAQLRSSWLM